MAKKRGRQRKHWAEKARVWIWYWKIKDTCGWSDYKLDNEFAWTEKGRSSFSLAQRPRTFEWIRKEARKPAGNDPRWRGMDELVVAVDQHPLFKGSKFLYEAELWSMLQETVVTSEVVEARINHLFKIYDLIRVPHDQLTDDLGRLTETYDKCLSLSIEHMAPWSRIELVWCLFLQNAPTHNWRIRSLLESTADSLLDHFFLACPDGRDFYSNAIDALINTKLDTSSIGPGYGRLESIGPMPVLPKVFVNQAEDRHPDIGYIS